MKNIKRMIAIILVICMACSLLPTASVFAADEAAAPVSRNIDFTNPADVGKFTIDNQTVSEIQDGKGFYMISTREAFENCKGQLSGNAAKSPRDVVRVPVEGDWTAILNLKVDTSGSNGNYEFLSFFAMADYDNGVGVRAGNKSTVNFKQVDGTNESSISGMKLAYGLTSGTDHWYKLEKVGTTYTAYASDNGETYDKVFTYENTGIEAKMIVIDAYSGSSVGYQYWLQSLEFEGDEPAPCKHNYVAVVTDPTCLDGGFTTYTCSMCGDSYVADEIAALGHDYKNGKCTRCGSVQPGMVSGADYYEKVNELEENGAYILTIRDEATVHGGTLFTFEQNGTVEGTYSMKGSSAYMAATMSALSCTSSSITSQASWTLTMEDGAVTLRNNTSSKYYLLYNGTTFVVNKNLGDPIALYDAEGNKLTSLPEGPFQAYICNPEGTKFLSEGIVADDLDKKIISDYVIADELALETISLGNAKRARKIGNGAAFVYHDGKLYISDGKGLNEALNLAEAADAAAYADGKLQIGEKYLDVVNGILSTSNTADSVQLWKKCVAPAQNGIYLPITSDIHYKFRADFATDSETGEVIGSTESIERLSAWLDKLSADFGGIYFDQFISCGDQGDANTKFKGDDYWARVGVAMDGVANHEKVLGGGFFINGNHEWQNGQYNSYKDTNGSAKRIHMPGYVEETDNYVIYSLSAAQTNNSFDVADIEALDAYLATAPADKPIFIVSHYPLHNYNRTEKRRDDVITVLNKYADTKQVIFLWGHNHTEEDPNYGTVFTKDSENIPDDLPIKFTYASAGCMTDDEYDAHAVATTAKGLLAYIAGDGSVSLTYYDVNFDVMSTKTLAKPAGHAAVKVEPKAATCTETGIATDCWYCDGCGCYFADEACENALATSDVVLPVLAHTLVATEAKAATCTEAGNTAYWTCSVCGKTFSNAEGTKEISVESTAVSALGHDYVDGYCTRCGAVDPNFDPAVKAAQDAALAAEAAQKSAADAKAAAEAAAQAAGEDKTAAEAAQKAAEEAKAAAEAAQKAADAANDAAANSNATAAEAAKQAAQNAAEIAAAKKEVADAQARIAELVAKAEQDLAEAKRLEEEIEAAKAEAERVAAEAKASELNSAKAYALAEIALTAAISKNTDSSLIADAIAAINAAETVTDVEKALDNILDQLTCPSKHFIDVPAEGYWAHEGIDYCVRNGFMQGYSATKFVPEDVLTRAQLVTILYRVVGQPEVTISGMFDDVPAGMWYTEAIEWAATNDIVNGKKEGVFDPMGQITREQIAAILYRYSGSPAVEGELAFPDADKVSNYAKDAMLWAVNTGLINGTAEPEGIILAPNAVATREQIATIIMRFLDSSN